MMFLIFFAATLACVMAQRPVWHNGPCGRSMYGDAGSMPLPLMVVGGIQSRPHEFPWQTSVRRKATNSHYCGGSIINRRWILTAAHCMTGETPAITSVVIGDHTRNEAAAANPHRLSLDVERIVIHPQYNRNTFQNDIALIKVTTDIQFKPEIQPICAPISNNLYTHRKCLSSGWGTLQSGGACCPQTLMYVTMNVTTNAYCDAVYTRDTIYADMICATDNTGSRERDTCQGDSGGPLAVQEADNTFCSVGIVSWGIGCASGYPGVYCRTAFQNDWITGTIDSV